MGELIIQPDPDILYPARINGKGVQTNQGENGSTGSEIDLQDFAAVAWLAGYAQHVM